MIAITMGDPCGIGPEIVVKALAQAVRRPYGVPVPAFALRLALQDAAQQLLLADQRVVPRKLLDDGFVFRDPTVQDAMDRLVEVRAA